MPKVSEEYRESRKEQILDAAKRCFIRDGFHETSMQDIFAESQMSAGAVYGYFRSKDDMILAIAGKNMREIITLIHGFATGAHPDGIGAALAAVLDIIRRKHKKDQLGSMAVLVWSEALRKPELAKRFDVLIGEMRTELTKVIRDHQAHGRLTTEVAPEAMANLVVTIIPGYILELAVFGDRAVKGVPDAARALWPG